MKLGQFEAFRGFDICGTYSANVKIYGQNIYRQTGFEREDQAEQAAIDKVNEICQDGLDAVAKYAADSLAKLEDEFQAAVNRINAIKVK